MFMKPETAKRLHDAASACDELKSFTADWSREGFLVNRGQQLIVWKLVEIVGEALHQGEARDPSLREHLPELRDVVDTRNRITHGYDSVDFGLLWDIVVDEMPELRQRLGNLLAE
jgi:uncharacterized protein with HEPN domain